eukprot:3113321-Amphidinium_carterae.1
MWLPSNRNFYSESDCTSGSTLPALMGRAVLTPPLLAMTSRPGHFLTMCRSHRACHSHLWPPCRQ